MKLRFGFLGILAMGFLVMPSDGESRGFGGGYSGGGASPTRSNTYNAGGGYSRSNSGGNFNRYYGGGDNRSFGGYSAGAGYNRSYGAYSGGGAYGGSRSYGGYNNYSSYGGGFRGDSYSYDRDYSTARGGSVSVSGAGGAAVGPYGGAVAGGTRQVTATTAGGRTVTTDSRAGVAVGPAGNAVAGGSRYGVAYGPNGAVAAGTRFGAATVGPGGLVEAGAVRYPTDMGLAGYPRVGGIATTYPTYLWSGRYLADQGNYVRASFNRYNVFTPAWYRGYPGAWAAAGYVAGNAWSAANWSNLSNWCSIPANPIDYDYGNTIVYQGDSVYVNGSNPIPAADYAAGVAVLADQGRTTDPPNNDQWQSMGVFALVEGSQESPDNANAVNNIFQLAVNQTGIIRGNFYDALADATTPVYGAVDKPSQRAAWSVGDKKDIVYEAGVYNLTKDQTAVLVHTGKDKTQQWMLVRVQQPEPQADQAQN